MMAPAPTRPPLRYHGSKWEVAPWLISHFPEHGVYTEAFGGGAAVLLRKAACGQEFYNDLDGEIVNLFRVLRSRWRALRRALELTPFAREEFDLSFKLCGDGVEQARRTIVRSFMGMAGGLTRTNRDGTPQRTGFRCYPREGRRNGYTVEWASMPAGLDAAVERLKKVFIECCDALDLLRRCDAVDALHYVDPPYVHSTRTPAAGGSHRGYRFEMVDQDHERMAAVLHELVGPVVLSGYRCALYDRLFADWERHERPTHADGGRPRTEVIWLNRRACDARESGLFDAKAISA